MEKPSIIVLDESTFDMLTTAVREKNYFKAKVILEDAIRMKLPEIVYAEVREDDKIQFLFSRSVRLPHIVKQKSLEEETEKKRGKRPKARG